MTKTDYRPISCAAHSEYELWCMHRRRLRLAWRRGDGSDHAGERRALDMLTRAGEELLVVEDADGSREEIRLDRITRAEPL